MPLVRTEVKEKIPTPNKVGIYPPTIDPIVIPKKTKNFEDIMLFYQRKDQSRNRQI